MILLDTDHLSLLQHRHNPRALAFRERLEQLPTIDVATSIISVEEQTRGWLRLIRRSRQAKDQVQYYERLRQLLAFYGEWVVFPFDEAAAGKFDALRNERVSIGTMDLKIAAIALVNDATLLSSNLIDFRRVPGLRVEDWLAHEHS